MNNTVKNELIILRDKLKKSRTTREVEKLLVETFVNLGYKMTKNDTIRFQLDIQQEVPEVNSLILNLNRKTGRETQDVIADELNIPQ